MVAAPIYFAKKDLAEKISAFGRNSNNRFELMIAFLKDANQAEKYAEQENPERIRDFLKKIGSNFRIAERTLACDFKNAFKIAEKYRAEVQRTEATSYDFAKSENWRVFTTKLEPILLKISDDILPAPLCGAGRKTCRLAGKKWRSLRGGNFLPARRPARKIFRQEDKINSQIPPVI